MKNAIAPSTALEAELPHILGKLGRDAAHDHEIALWETQIDEMDIAVCQKLFGQVFAHFVRQANGHLRGTGIPEKQMGKWMRGLAVPDSHTWEDLVSALSPAISMQGSDFLEALYSRASSHTKNLSPLTLEIKKRMLLAGINQKKLGAQLAAEADDGTKQARIISNQLTGVRPITMHFCRKLDKAFAAYPALAEQPSMELEFYRHHRKLAEEQWFAAATLGSHLTLIRNYLDASLLDMAKLLKENTPAGHDRKCSDRSLSIKVSVQAHDKEIPSEPLMHAYFDAARQHDRMLHERYGIPPFFTETRITGIWSLYEEARAAARERRIHEAPSAITSDFESVGRIGKRDSPRTLRG